MSLFHRSRFRTTTVVHPSDAEAAAEAAEEEKEDRLIRKRRNASTQERHTAERAEAEDKEAPSKAEAAVGPKAEVAKGEKSTWQYVVSMVRGLWLVCEFVSWAYACVSWMWRPNLEADTRRRVHLQTSTLSTQPSTLTPRHATLNPNPLL